MNTKSQSYRSTHGQYVIFVSTCQASRNLIYTYVLEKFVTKKLCKANAWILILFSIETNLLFKKVLNI